MPNMKCVRIHRFGGPEVLQLDTLPIPEPKAHEVLVRVHAASVNPVDYKTRAGKFPLVKREDLPRVLGRDISGVVERCGDKAGYLKPGDRICALLGHHQGGYCEHVALQADLATLKPVSSSDREAAALPLAALTAFQGLFEHGQLQAEQRVLIHGGAGGIGHLAIQLAKAKGARVCTTVRADDMDFVSTLGADEAVDYEVERFENVFKPVHLVLDLIGGETQQRSWKVLQRGGALISTVAPPSEALAREHGVRAALFLTQPNAAQLAEIARLVDTDEVRPHVSASFALERVADAHRHLEEEHTCGKVVLVVND
jgi:NADPH:quinone reductase-like Zn-dependent oxidoreductase